MRVFYSGTHAFMPERAIPEMRPSLMLSFWDVGAPAPWGYSHRGHQQRIQTLVQFRHEAILLKQRRRA
jgi:hypothetical protein